MRGAAMILTHSLKVCLAVEPCDLRKSFDSPAAVVRGVLGEDPLSRKVFVFANRSRDRVKLLYWDGSGLWENGVSVQILTKFLHLVGKRPAVISVMHDNDKVIYCNPHYRRLDLLRQLDKLPGRRSFKAEVIQPGGTDWRSLVLVEKDGVVVLDVPLRRGCAMVRMQ
jgi:hypothetical protein